MKRSSEEAAVALLGAIAIRNEAIDEVVDLIEPADFPRVHLQRVFEAARRLRTNGRPIDPVTLAEELGRTGDLEDVSKLFLLELGDGVPRSTNVRAYACIVKEDAEHRRLRAEIARAAATLDRGERDEALNVLAAAGQSAGGRPDRAAVVEARITDELQRERIRREARRRLELETRGATPAPDIATLRDRLARPRVPLRYRIEGWQMRHSRVMLTAQFKAGKTSLRDNYIASLLDGGLFLGRYHTEAISGALALIDTEMSPGQLDDWLGVHRIQNDDRVIVVPLRGALTSFDILDATIRAQWSECLRLQSVEVLVVDCLRPLLDAFGLDEHRDAGRLLVAIDQLMLEAGISEALLVHHMGHGGERARGDSRLRDWPDAEWRLVRQDDDPGAQRFITAYGRDVDVPEVGLEFDSRYAPPHRGRRIPTGRGHGGCPQRRAGITWRHSRADERSWDRFGSPGHRSPSRSGPQGNSDRH